MDSISNKNISLGWLHTSFILLILAHQSISINNLLSSNIYVNFSLQNNLVLITAALLGILLLIARKNASELKYKRLFNLVVVLCVTKVISLIITTIGSFVYDMNTPFNPDNIFGNKIDTASEFIDVYLLSTLFLMIGISFIMREPYFYATAKKKRYIIFGSLLVLLSLLLFVAMSLAIRDICRL